MCHCIKKSKVIILLETKKLVQEQSKPNILKRRGQHIGPAKEALAPLKKQKK
jgi:hypothetical protein